MTKNLFICFNINIEAEERLMNITAVTNTNFKTRVNNSTSYSSDLNTPSPALKQTPDDCWNFSINKKKTVKFAAFTAAAAILAGVILALRKGKVPEGANEMVKEANEFTKTFREKFQSTIDEVTALYKNGGKDAEGNIIATIAEDADIPSIKFMDKITQDGKTPSLTGVFVNDKLGSIKKLRDDGKLDVIFLEKNGQITNCQEGLETFDNGDFNIAKEAYLENGKPFMFAKGFNFKKDSSKGGVWTIEREVYISEKNKPVSYVEKRTMDGTGEYKANKWMTFWGKSKLTSKWHNLAKGIHKA